MFLILKKSGAQGARRAYRKENGELPDKKGRAALGTLPITQKNGINVKIRSLDALPPAIKGRLCALGLFRGSRAKLLQRRSDGSAILSFRGTRMAFGGNLTAQIEVEVID